MSTVIPALAAAGEGWLSVGRGMLTAEMSRHTTFKFCLDPTVKQHEVLARHAGASRFAFNQCLGLVQTALTGRRTDQDIDVPWTAFDLINAFNAWKKTEDAGRVFMVDTDGVSEPVVTGLAWRSQVCQQVFEEAAVDLGKGLKAWSDSRSGKRKGRRIGFPASRRRPALPRRFDCVTSTPGAVRRRSGSATTLANERAKILFATVTHHGGHWWVSLNVEAADVHPAHQHPLRAEADHGGWVGVDRGLSAFLVAATSDGEEVARIGDAPKALRAGMARQRRLSKSLSRKQKGSAHRRQAATKLGRHHHRNTNVRRHFLHQVSNALVKTHDRLVIEDLNVTGMLRNHRLAQAISDAGWAEFARLLRYKQAWRGGDVLVAGRWFPSSKRCPECGTVRGDLNLAERVFTCGCGHSADRDRNAATNLARWGQAHHDPHRSPDPQAGGRATNARRRDGAGQHPTCAGETSPDDAGTDIHTAPAA